MPNNGTRCTFIFRKHIWREGYFSLCVTPFTVALQGTAFVNLSSFTGQERGIIASIRYQQYFDNSSEGLTQQLTFWMCFKADLLCWIFGLGIQSGYWCFVNWNKCVFCDKKKSGDRMLHNPSASATRYFLCGYFKAYKILWAKYLKTEKVYPHNV